MSVSENSPSALFNQGGNSIRTYKDMQIIQARRPLRSKDPSNYKMTLYPWFSIMNHSTIKEARLILVWGGDLISDPVKRSKCNKGVGTGLSGSQQPPRSRRGELSGRRSAAFTAAPGAPAVLLQCILLYYCSVQRKVLLDVTNMKPYSQIMIP